MFALFGVSAILGAVDAAAVGAPSGLLEGLSADDACVSEGPCALHALQSRSHRAPATSGPADAREAAVEAAAEAGAEEDTYVWSHDQVLAGIGTSDHFLKEFEPETEKFGQVINSGCPHYFMYFWPQLSFWSQEILRRVEALPSEPTPQQTAELQHFTRDVAYLSCVWRLDPRQGSNDWVGSTREYMKMFSDLPSSSLEVPSMPSFFAEMPEKNRSGLVVTEACLFWTTTLACDLGYLARDLQGSKSQYVDGELCWDKVEAPEYGFPIMNISIMPEKRAMTKEEAKFEMADKMYSACQDKPLTKEHADNICPLGGHWPDGFLGSNWGTPAPAGSQLRADVNTCNRILGNPELAYFSGETLHIADEGDDIDVLKPFRGPLVNKTANLEKKKRAANLTRADMPSQLAGIEAMMGMFLAPVLN